MRWELQGEYIVIEVFARMQEDQYAAFGLSGVQGRPQMVCSSHMHT